MATGSTGPDLIDESGAPITSLETETGGADWYDMVRMSADVDSIKISDQRPNWVR